MYPKILFSKVVLDDISMFRMNYVALVKKV